MAARIYSIIVKTGKGKVLLANQKIPADTQIGIVTGKVLDDPNYESRYAMSLGDEGHRVLEPRNAFRYMSHSCEPNASLYIPRTRNDEKPTYLEVWATRDIGTKEEITIDYEWPLHYAIPCLCGSANCRGWIISKADLPKKLRELKRKRAKSRA